MPVIMSPHNILSPFHLDTLTDTVARGDIFYGNSTPKWARLAKSAGLLSNDGTDVSWATNLRASSNLFEIYNGANAQSFRLGNTITTPGTAGEWFGLRWASNQARFGAIRGSSSGTAQVASWDYGGTEASPSAAITVPATSGVISFGGTLNVSGSLQILATANMRFNGRGFFYAASDGKFVFTNDAVTDFGMLHFGGSTSSFPALKRSSAVLQSRLADDSAFAQIQGKLTTDANATTGLTAGALAATTNATITITDASGQVYRVPVII